MIHFSKNFIDRLRQRPLHQRYLILWTGSFVLFGLIFAFWLFQLKVKLASIGLTPLNESIGVRSEKQVTLGTGKESEKGRLGEFYEVLEDASASFFSLFQKEKEKGLPSKKEGDELDQFLPYQPFPQ